LPEVATEQTAAPVAQQKSMSSHRLGLAKVLTAKLGILPSESSRRKASSNSADQPESRKKHKINTSALHSFQKSGSLKSGFTENVLGNPLRWRCENSLPKIHRRATSDLSEP
jgi:hypothetical protein